MTRIKGATRLKSKPKEEKVQITLTLPKSLLDKIEYSKEQNRRVRSAEICYALDKVFK